MLHVRLRCFYICGLTFGVLLSSSVMRSNSLWAKTPLQETNPVAAFASTPLAEPLTESGLVHRFDRQALTRVYYSEGAAVGDLNRDGQADIVYGPHWYAGPDFKVAREIYPAKPQPMSGYADHFFAWTHDFNADGWDDVLAVGFPGTPAYVYENPGEGIADAGNWTKHEVFDWVSNESPAFADLTGDGRPELVCTREGMYGYASPSFKGFEPWTFRRISG